VAGEVVSGKRRKRLLRRSWLMRTTPTGYPMDEEQEQALRDAARPMRDRACTVCGFLPDGSHDCPGLFPDCPREKDKA
jgi:hypothetical protein